jgi:hypothetical protein
MPLAYADVTQLCSLTMAISAIGIAVDGVMVPRLEKFRDYIMTRSSEILDNDEGRKALEVGLMADDAPATYIAVKNEFDQLQSIRDDLTETFYFDELSSYLFLGGSIVRALVITMVSSSILLLWATVVTGDYFPYQCQMRPLSPQIAICKMEFISAFAMFFVSYIVLCFVRYLFLWHRKISELAMKRISVRNSASNLNINLQLIQANQNRGPATK